MVWVVMRRSSWTCAPTKDEDAPILYSQSQEDAEAVAKFLSAMATGGLPGKDTEANEYSSPWVLVKKYDLTVSFFADDEAPFYFVVSVPAIPQSLCEQTKEHTNDNPSSH